MNSKLTKDAIKLLKSSLPDRRSGSLEILRKVAVRNKEMMTTNLETFTSIYTELPDGIYDLTNGYLITNDAFAIDDYPEMAGYDWGETYQITKPQIKVLQRLAKFCSQDTTRPVLCSIKIKDGTIRVAGKQLVKIGKEVAVFFGEDRTKPVYAKRIK